MKEQLERLRAIAPIHRLHSEDGFYLFEMDLENGSTGVVFGFFNKRGEDFQEGLSRADFLSVYPSYAPLLPVDNIVISFLEFASLDDFEKNELEKAYYIYVDETGRRNDPNFPEGLAGYPVSLNPSIVSEAQAAVPATEENIKNLPEDVFDKLPFNESLSYIRFNQDHSRVSCEVEYEVEDADIDTFELKNVGNDVIRTILRDASDFIGSGTVKLMAKYTSGKDTPKIYINLSECTTCQ